MPCNLEWCSSCEFSRGYAVQCRLSGKGVQIEARNLDSCFNYLTFTIYILVALITIVFDFLLLICLTPNKTEFHEVTDVTILLPNIVLAYG